MSLEHTTPTTALSAEQAAWLADTMARNHARFGGWSMEADPGSDPGADPADPPADPADPDPADPQDDPDDSRIQKANREAQRYRTERNTLQQQLEAAQQAQQEMLANIAKALGITPDGGNDDPAKQVTDLTGQVQSLSGDKAALEAQLVVHDLASSLNAKASALLDSNAFNKTLSGLDPTSDTYRTQVADAIKDAVSKNPAYRSGAGKGGSELDPNGREQNKQRKGLGAAISAVYRG